jgi:hypothetical protein
LVDRGWLGFTSRPEADSPVAATVFYPSGPRMA